MDSILIIALGGSEPLRLARKFRELGYYSELVAVHWEPRPEDLQNVRGLVIAGEPSATSAGIDSGRSSGEEVLLGPGILRSGLPLLGLGRGFSALVRSLDREEGGSTGTAMPLDSSPLFAGLDLNFPVPNGSGKRETGDLPPGFTSFTAPGEDHPLAGQDQEGRIHGVFFSTGDLPAPAENRILDNFARQICGAGAHWSMENYRESLLKRIRREGGDKKVLLLISGGVDSTVTAALLLTALPPENLHLMYIDTGLMRKDESLQVSRDLRALGAQNLHLIDASDTFLAALRGIEDPEEKRRAIGDSFIRVQEEEVARLRIPEALLAQGTLYTDIIESGGEGSGGGTVKSHHNVRSPLVEEKRKKGLIIEPLDRLFKDEVRALGALLGLSPAILKRHPFPGPGLGVRILGEVNREKADLLREADAVYLRELEKRGLYDQIWQAFSILLPVRSVGVAGDSREYGYVLALRAVNSQDGLKAEVFDFPPGDLFAIAATITREVRGIGRVVYDISSKPPATIEWE